MLHEFESLVLAGVNAVDWVTTDVQDTVRKAIAEEDGNPESVNDSSLTSPSKRLRAVWPTYSKVSDGVNIIREAGIDTVRAQCPRFNRWLDRLERVSHVG